MSLNKLRRERDMIALEAGAVASIKDLLRKAFPVLKDELSSFFHLHRATEQALSLTRQQNNFIRDIGKHSYMEITGLGAYVPEGLDVTYLEYLEVLQPAAQHCATNLLKVMSDFTVYMSLLISNEDQKFSTNAVYTDVRKKELERNEANIAMGKCFAKGSTRTDVTLEKVIKRNNDWERVFTLAEAVVRDVNSVDRTALNKKIEETIKLLDVIQKKLTRDDFDGASSEVARNIAEMTYAVAGELEFYSTIYYKTTALSEAINRTVDHFNTVFKK